MGNIIKGSIGKIERYRWYTPSSKPSLCFRDLISCNYKNLFVGHFVIKKTRELIARIYFWHIFCQDVKVYIKDCNIWLTSKIICHKLFKNL